jgi:hypothetical protein
VSPRILVLGVYLGGCMVGNPTDEDYVQALRDAHYEVTEIAPVSPAPASSQRCFLATRRETVTVCFVHYDTVDDEVADLQRHEQAFDAIAAMYAKDVTWFYPRTTRSEYVRDIIEARDRWECR